jgi:hypothetical protein
MDVHPTKNVSIGIDPYLFQCPFVPCDFDASIDTSGAI